MGGGQPDDGEQDDDGGGGAGNDDKHKAPTRLLEVDTRRIKMGQGGRFGAEEVCRFKTFLHVANRIEIESEGPEPSQRPRSRLCHRLAVADLSRGPLACRTQTDGKLRRLSKRLGVATGSSIATSTAFGSTLT